MCAKVWFGSIICAEFIANRSISTGKPITQGQALNYLIKASLRTQDPFMIIQGFKGLPNWSLLIWIFQRSSQKSLKRSFKGLFYMRWAIPVSWASPLYPQAGSAYALFVVFIWEGGLGRLPRSRFFGPRSRQAGQPTYKDSYEDSWRLLKILLNLEHNFLRIV